MRKITIKTSLQKQAYAQDNNSKTLLIFRAKPKSTAGQWPLQSLQAWGSFLRILHHGGRERKHEVQLGARKNCKQITELESAHDEFCHSPRGRGQDGDGFLLAAKTKKIGACLKVCMFTVDPNKVIVDLRMLAFAFCFKSQTCPIMNPSEVTGSWTLYRA